MENRFVLGRPPLPDLVFWRRGHRRALFHPAPRHEQALEIELGDRRKGRKVLERRVIDDVGEGSLSVEEAKDTV
jgi:hypothetical protein